MAEIRPSTAADFEEMLGQRPAYRGRFVSIEESGELLAIGGVLFRPDGCWASAAISDKARARPVTLHKAARRVFRAALELGNRPIFSVADPGQPRAQAWLERLGFTRTDAVDDRGLPIFVMR